MQIKFRKKNRWKICNRPSNRTTIIEKIITILEIVVRGYETEITKF